MKISVYSTYAYSSVVVIGALNDFSVEFLLILPLCSINRHDGHACCLAGLLNMILKVVTLRIIQANFVLHWHSGLRAEYFFKA